MWEDKGRGWERKVDYVLLKNIWCIAIEWIPRTNTVLDAGKYILHITTNSELHYNIMNIYNDKTLRICNFANLFKWNIYSTKQHGLEIVLIKIQNCNRRHAEYIIKAIQISPFSG